MPDRNAALPEGFEDLAIFADTWGSIARQEEAYLMRQASSMADLQTFYDAVAPRLPAIFEHLDRFPVDALPPPQTLLFRIACGLAEAAQAVEIFRQPGVPYSPSPHVVRMDWSDEPPRTAR